MTPCERCSNQFEQGMLHKAVQAPPALAQSKDYAQFEKSGAFD
jgi:hypothetical protein